MKRSPRFYFALLFAKATARVMKLIGRKGTSMPGSWAIILCPDFLGRMPRPKTIIGITGNYGKTFRNLLLIYDFINGRIDFFYGFINPAGKHAAIVFHTKKISLIPICKQILVFHQALDKIICRHLLTILWLTKLEHFKLSKMPT